MPQAHTQVTCKSHKSCDLLKVALLVMLPIILSGCPRSHRTETDTQLLSPGSPRASSGAVPEYRPASGLMVSAELDQFINLQDFLAKIAQSGLKKLTVIDNTFQNNSKRWPNESGSLKIDKMVFDGIQRTSLWVRDYGPIWTKQPDGQLGNLDFKYFRNGKPTFEDHVGHAYQCKASVPSQKVDLVFEGGNLALAQLQGKLFCLTTDEFTERNKDRGDPKEVLKQATGCQEVIVFGSLLGESTRHVDIWLKPLKDGVIAVAQLSDQSRDAAQSLGDNDEGDSPEDFAHDNQRFLNNAAKALQARGFRVVRLPMPTPLTKADLYKRDDPTYRTYLNSLILNNHVYVPRYRMPHSILGLKQYPDSPLIAAYEKSVESVYRAEGLTVHWIDSDYLITQGGSIHCVTSQIPQCDEECRPLKRQKT